LDDDLSDSILTDVHPAAEPCPQKKQEGKDQLSSRLLNQKGKEVGRRLTDQARVHSLEIRRFHSTGLL